jgi:signal transduction histidine kinase/ligand-binding sensor domain-containing protein/DNA-binding response OmpR family regulator
MGTRDGLNRYDGYDFLTFKNDPQDTNSLSNNEITSICVNAEGNLWIGTRGGGLNYFDQALNKFTRYSDLNYENIVRDIYESQDGTVWVGTSDGLLEGKFDKNKQIYHFVNVSKNAEFRGVYGEALVKTKRIISAVSIHPFFNDELLIGSELGVYLFNKETRIFKQLSLGESDYTIVTSVLPGNNGTLWIGTFNGLVKLIPQQLGNYKIELLNSRPSGGKRLLSNRIEALESDPFGNIWVATHGGGLVKIDKSEKITTFLNDRFDNQSIGDNIVNSLFMDNTGVLWIGTEIAGCNKLDLYRKKFFHYKNVPNKANCLSDNQITAIAGTNGKTIWLGTSSKGIDKLMFNEDGTYKIDHITSIPGDNNAISEIISLFQEKDGDLWIGAASNSICRYKEGKGFKTYTTNGFVFAIRQDRAGEIWFGTWGQGLGKINKRTGEITRFLNIPGNSRSLSSDMVLSLFDDDEGNLWLGTKAGGVNLIQLSDLAKGINGFMSFKHNEKEPLSLVHNDVFCITQDSKGNIWLGTGGGLCKVSRKNGQRFFEEASAGKLQFETFLEKDGLPGNIVYGILEDNHGNLWISTNNGLSVFTPLTRQFRNYRVNDGIQANEFLPNAYLKDQKGNMFFGGINGVTVFNPDSISENPSPLRLVITRLKIFNTAVNPETRINGRRILEKDITRITSLKLTYKEKEITLDFSALHYANPQRIRYQYRMLGFNDAWQTAEPNNRSVTYTNLYDGDYVFQVRACNIEGKWTDPPLEMHITVLPPFWRQPWFYLIYAIIIIILLISYRRYSLIAVKEKNRLVLERLEHKKVLEMTEAKTRFFTNVSHEIRTPLTLIADPLDQVLTNGDMDENSRKHLLLISKNVGRLLNMVDQLLQLRNIDMGSVTLRISEVKLEPFLKEIKEHFDQISGLRKINFSLNCHLSDPYLYFDLEMMGTVFFNLLSNAFKYTPDGGSILMKVYSYQDTITPKNTISIKRLIWGKSQGPDWVAFEITDTGSGIPRNELKNIFHRFYQLHNKSVTHQGGSGIGLSLVKEYIELHKGVIKVNSVPGQGATFTVYLRKGKKHFRHELLSAGKFDNLKVPVDESQKANSEIESSVSVNNNGKQDVPSLLIIEDDHELSGYLYDYFKTTYNVSQVFNGKTGLEMAIEQCPDIIISDVMMPEMNGFQVCHKLKITIETSHIPVILLTAKVNDENIAQGYELGADLYISKPFNIQILDKQVKMLINSRNQLKDKFSKQVLLKPSDIPITSPDERFLKRLIEITDAHITDSEFDVLKLVDSMNMSHTVILRKLKALTGMALVDFIKRQRLKKAALILQKGKISIAEVSYMVGFSDPKYFSKCFIKEFGQTPTDYSKDHRTG